MTSREVAAMFGCSMSAARYRMRLVNARKEDGRLDADRGALEALAYARATDQLARWGFAPGNRLELVPRWEEWVTVKEASLRLRRRKADVLRASRGCEHRGAGTPTDPRYFRLADLRARLRP